MIEQERTRLGLDRPIYVQFGKWLGGMATGDFGVSMWTGKPVSQEIASRLQLSLQVAVMATVLAVLISIPLGTLSALYKDTWIDHVIRVISIAGLAVPSFWLGMIIILVLLSYFHWHPPITFTPFLENPRENLSQLIWPALAVGYRYSAVATRMMRSTLLEVLQEDYIRTARAKGVFERLVVMRHALSNAMLPVVTVIGLEFAFLIGGLVVTEQVFNLNGIGKLFVQAVSRSDFTMVQALVLLVAAFFIVVNFVIDLMYAWLDPRIRYRLMSAVPATLEITYKVPRRRHPVLAFVLQQPLGTAGLAIIVLMLVAAAFAKWVAPYDPLAVDYGGILAPPSWKHLLGTDNFGRDVFSRIIYGSQTALSVGFLSSLGGCTLGAIIGVASAYFGGRTDMIVQRFMDVILAFPIIVLALAVVGVHGQERGLRDRLEPDHRHRIADGSEGRARRALLRARRARDAVYRRGAHRRFLARAHHLPPHRSERRRALSHHAHRVRRAGHSAGGFAVVPRAGRDRAHAGLGSHAVGVGDRLLSAGAVDDRVSRRGDQPRRVRVQPVRRLAARLARPEDQDLTRRSASRCVFCPPAAP